MRFNIPPKPNDRDKRAVKTFAWLPIKINNQYVWLEDFWRLQIYRVYCGPRTRASWCTVRLATIGLDFEASGWAGWPIV